MTATGIHTNWRFAALIVAVAGPVGTMVACADETPAERRMALLRSGEQAPSVGELRRALADDDPIVARTAARLLHRKGKAAVPALQKALEHDDVLVRRNAILGLGKLPMPPVSPIAKAMADDSPLVRQAAVIAIGQVGADTKRLQGLLRQANDDDSDFVRGAAQPVTRRVFQTVNEVQLPRKNWRFRTDPEDIGRKKAWYRRNYDDSEWAQIPIGQFWGKAGYDYTGVAWYRRRFALPEKGEGEWTQLAFGAVDESAWVWLNGKMAGVYNVGPDGWDKPFQLDVTGMLNWGGENQITVRVLNTAAAGGIWKPVTILALQPAGQ